MAYTHSASLSISVEATLQNAADLSGAKDVLMLAYGLALTTGTGASQANRHWHERRTLGGGNTYFPELDEIGFDAFGNLVAFATVRALVIANRNTGAGEVLRVGGNLDHPWLGWLGLADIAIIGPGGLLVIASPLSAGMPVETGEGILQFTNPNAGALTFDLIIIGSTS